LEKNLPVIDFEMWYVLVVIIVQSELKLYDLTVVDAGVEMKLKKFSKVCNPFAKRKPSCACLIELKIELIFQIE